jgi:hypothetical protein
MDNLPILKAKVVKVKLSQMTINRAPRPAHSLNLAPSDLFLFGHLKNRRLGLEFDPPDELFDWTNTEFQNMTRKILEKVVES